MALYTLKKNKKWILKAVDRSTRRTIAWVIGGRDAATFQRLYNKVRHLNDCTFYTDDWEAFSSVLPKNRHVVGKSGTMIIERDNSNNRHHLGRMTRRTKVVSKQVIMVGLSIRIWGALTNPSIFQPFQKQFLSIFK